MNTYKQHIVGTFTVMALIIMAMVANIPKVNAISKSDDAWAFAMDPALDYAIIVNEGNPYAFGGEHNKALQKDLVPVASDFLDDVSKIERATLIAFTMLKADLKAQGMTIGLMDAYRTFDEQQSVYDSYSKLEGWAEKNRVLPPGFTEHHTGLMLNIVVWYNGGEPDGQYQWWTETAERQQQYDYFKLLHETMPKYGFIDRYPAGKENITGVPCEPYEIRFVGSSAVAQEIHNKGLCLEEYIRIKK